MRDGTLDDVLKKLNDEGPGVIRYDVRVYTGRKNEYRVERKERKYSADAVFDLGGNGEYRFLHVIEGKKEVGCIMAERVTEVI